jgi:MoxR-like ATPase
MTFRGSEFDPGRRAEPESGAYVYHDRRIILAVRIALATRRPLFISGPPGSGKSTLAWDVATRLNWAYVQKTITSRTRLEDLVSRVDSVRRLADAQLGPVGNDREYLVPGVLWWAFDAASATEVAGADADPRVDGSRADEGIVVLLDEIDKAEPDLPNDLLAPLDRFEISVPGHPEIAAGPGLLVVVTSNGERAMPPAFLRRCVVLELGDDDPRFFEAVAISHFGARTDRLYITVARRTRLLAQQAEGERRRPPSMAEYLDTVRACLEFGVRPPEGRGQGSELWWAIEEATLRKTRAAPEGSRP